MAGIAQGARLAGKVAIVTGAGSGFGRGIAQRFAQEGAKVIVADINEKGGRDVASINPELLKFHKADVSKRSDWDSLLEVTRSTFGRVDCLVNNAGTTYRNKVRRRCHALHHADLVHSQQSRSQKTISTDASTSMSRECSLAHKPFCPPYLSRNKVVPSST